MRRQRQIERRHAVTRRAAAKAEETRAFSELVEESEAMREVLGEEFGDVIPRPRRVDEMRPEVVDA